MPTFKLKITTPDKIFFQDEVEKLIARTTAGDVGIMKDHVNYVATLRIDTITIINGKEKKVAAVAGGLLEVRDSVATILTTAAEWSDQIDVERAMKAKQRAEEKIKSGISDKEIKIQKAALIRAINRINCSKQ